MYETLEKAGSKCDTMCDNDVWILRLLVTPEKAGTTCASKSRERLTLSAARAVPRCKTCCPDATFERAKDFWQKGSSNLLDLTHLSPSLEVNCSNIKCGYASLMVPTCRQQCITVLLMDDMYQYA